MKKCSLLLYALLGSLIIACNSGVSDKPDVPSKPKDVVTIEEARQIIEENKGNDKFVLLDVRTNAEYNEGHLANAVQHDFYASDFDEWLLKHDKEKRYLLYCRTDKRAEKAFNKLKAANFKYIQYIKGGFTEWANNKYPYEKPEYEKVLDVYVSSDKIKTKDNITFNLKVTDLNDDPIRKADLSLKVVSSTNAEIEKKDIKMDNRGSATHTFDAQAWAKGKYRLICTPKKDDYKVTIAYYDFEVADQDEAVTGSSTEIAVQGDITAEMAKKFYNRNIYGYKVTDRTQKVISLGDKATTSGPTLLLFIQPLCTGCMDGAKELIKYDLTGVTLIPVITSVDTDDLANFISKTETQLTNLGLSTIVPITLYDSEDFMWLSRFKFGSTPKFILINKDGQIKDIIHGEQTIETVVKKMEKVFNLPPFTKS